MFRYQVQRVAARKKLLNRFDFIRFDDVLNFIIDSFFGSCTYKSRLLTDTFGWLNGLHIDQLLELCRWNDTKAAENGKMKSLYTTFESPFDDNYIFFN